MSAPPMMNHSRRETLTTSTGPSIKRKERDSFLNVLKPSLLTTKKLAKPSPHHRPSSAAAPTTKQSSQPLLSNNQLLAGYLAHEFLSKGTLLGQPFDPARAEAVPVSSAASSSRGLKPPRLAKPAQGKEKQQMEKYRRYTEVADLLRTNGAHLPGVVNPTQLVRFLQLE